MHLLFPTLLFQVIKRLTKGKIHAMKASQDANVLTGLIFRFHLI